MHTICSTRYQSSERCMELSRYAKAQISPDYLSFHISNRGEIWEIGKFLKRVKINQEKIKKVKKKSGLPGDNPVKSIILLYWTGVLREELSSSCHLHPAVSEGHRLSGTAEDCVIPRQRTDRV